MPGWAFLSACQEAGMFNVLIIGYAVVYISLSAPPSHLNCQSTSKACRSFIFPWRSQCSASAECQWFVMTWELADRQVLWKEGGRKKGSFLSHCENINVPVMGYNCQRRPAPDSCVASLICSPGDLHSSQFGFGCGVTHKQPAICCSPFQERAAERGKDMLIEGASSFQINH